MKAKMSLETAQHLAGLVSRFFDNISEAAPDFFEDMDIIPFPGDFVEMCRDFTTKRNELAAAGEIDGAVVALARDILGLK